MPDADRDLLSRERRGWSEAGRFGLQAGVFGKTAGKLRAAGGDFRETGREVSGCRRVLWGNRQESGLPEETIRSVVLKKKSHIERRDSELVYISDETVFEEQKRARRLTQQLNTADRSDFEELKRIAKELLGKSDNAFINPPFYCDYGSHIEVGKDFFANYNCTILDVGIVRIGDNVQFAPNVAVYTAGHPVHPATRNTLYEYGIDVTIGNNVWIGGNVVICPGVTIGDNTVIGAGSVVTKDIPAWSVAAGNPCRVIRKITEDDRRKYYAGWEIDEEAWEDIQRIQAEEKNEVKYPTAPE